MGSLIALELNKAFHSKVLWLSFAVLTAVALFSSVDSIINYMHDGLDSIAIMVKAYMVPFSLTPYRYWMPVDRAAFWANLFVLLAPLFIASAYSWSLRSEVMNGHAQQILAHANRVNYLTAKLIVTFVCGGLAVALPLAVNFITLCCFIPLYTPEIDSVTVTGMYESVAFSALFYQNPPLFIAVRLVIDFVLGGMWATFVAGLSICISNRVALVLIPYIGLLALKYASEFLYQLAGIKGQSITLIDLLRVTGDRYVYSWETLLICAVVLAILHIPFVLRFRRKDVQ